MEKVLGIGGLFFRSRNPDELKQWYTAHLGVTHYPNSWQQDVWQQESGPTVFEPFVHDTDYFGRVDQQWMVNFRVADLDAMIKQLEAANISVETREEWDSEVGRFARIHDPDGNPIELWQPSAAD